MRWLKMYLVFLPTLAWNVLLGRWLRVRRWWDRVDDHVLLGALPFARDVPALEQAGVRGVINMCAEYSGPAKAYGRAGIEQLWLPTIDFTPPTLADVERGVAFIERHAARGEGVYVHCKAGRGRSATIVLCWLMRSRCWSAEEAQRYLQERRPHINRGLAERPVVREFAKTM